MGANTSMDFLLQHEKILVSPSGNFETEAENVELAAIRKQCRRVIQQYSWDMVFAQDEKHFNTLLQEMQNKLKNLKYDEILAFDLKNAKSIEKQKKLLPKKRT